MSSNHDAVKDAVNATKEESILTEAARGEDSAVKTYESALQTPLPPSAESIVKNQYMEVKDVHDRVRALEEKWKQRK